MDNNKVDILSSFGGYFELDDLFVSKQTFGFWTKVIDEAKIHNDIVNLDKLDFKKYSKFNRKNKLLNYQKVKILYDLAVKIRNRAFHFENLYKLNDDQTPRISTRVGKTLVGIDPQMLEDFINGGKLRDKLDDKMKEKVDVSYKEIMEHVNLQW